LGCRFLGQVDVLGGQRLLALRLVSRPVVSISGDMITVTTSTTEKTVFLSIVGITTITSHGEATVRIAEDL
jgi:hypothetical protein